MEPASRWAEPMNFQEPLGTFAGNTELFKTLPPYTQQDRKLEKKKVSGVWEQGNNANGFYVLFYKTLHPRKKTPKHGGVVVGAPQAFQAPGSPSLGSLIFLGFFSIVRGIFRCVFLVWPKIDFWPVFGPKNTQKCTEIPKNSNVELLFLNMAISYTVWKYFLSRSWLHKYFRGPVINIFFYYLCIINPQNDPKSLKKGENRDIYKIAIAGILLEGSQTFQSFFVLDIF